MVDPMVHLMVEMLVDGMVATAENLAALLAESLAVEWGYDLVDSMAGY